MVIAPVLFIFFISDPTEHFGPHIGYADDLSLWETNADLKLAIQAVESDFPKVSAWCYKWRTKVNLDKTDVQHFTRSLDKEIIVCMNGTPLKQVTKKHCLGVIVDDKLNYKDHIDRNCSTALKTLNKLGPAIKSANTEMSIHLYKTHIRPHLERTYPTWCGADHTHKQKVECEHRQALIRASGAMSTTAIADLDILLHVEPIRFRLDVVLMQSLTCQSYE